MANEIYEAVKPLTEFQKQEAHQWLALALDPRYCTLGIVRTLFEARRTFLALFPPGQVHYSSADETSQQRDEIHRLVKDYDDLLVQLVKDLEKRGAVEDHEEAYASNPDPLDKGVFEDIFSSNGPIDDDAEIVQELMRFRQKAKGSMKKDETGLSWWKRKGKDIYPNLAKLALHVLGIPGTQIECERVFSIAGILTRHRRSNTRVDLVDTIMYVHYNYPDAEALKAGVKVTHVEEEDDELIATEDSSTDDEAFSSDDEPFSSDDEMEEDEEEDQ